MSETIVAYQSFVGVDLHKETVTLTAVSPRGEVLARLKISTKSVGKIEAWLRALPRPCQMAVEAVGFVEWFIADDELMQLRKLGRHWRQLSIVLSRTKRYMKSLLLAANLRGPKFDGASAQRWLLAHGHRLKPVQRRAFANFTELIQLVELQRAPLRHAIIKASRSKRFAPIMDILQSVPGIGDIWGCIIAAEIGPFDRFPNADTLEFWSGLTADLKESAGRTQSGNITKAGSVALRWAICQAALTLCHSDAKQEATRQKLIKRIGNAKANVAMARRLVIATA